MDVLDNDVAAQAIGEVDDETQISILEELPSRDFKDIINKLPVSEIADIFYRLNPDKIKEVLRTLSHDRAIKLERLLVFPEDVAGGLMDDNYFRQDEESSVGEALARLAAYENQPEVIFLTMTDERQFKGTVLVKDIVGKEYTKSLREFISSEQYAKPEMEFDQLLRLFAQYNLRSLPVLDKGKKIIGVISIDTILRKLEEEEEEKNEAI